MPLIDFYRMSSKFTLKKKKKKSPFSDLAARCWCLTTAVKCIKLKREKRRPPPAPKPQLSTKNSEIREINIYIIFYNICRGRNT